MFDLFTTNFNMFSEIASFLGEPLYWRFLSIYLVSSRVYLLTTTATNYDNACNTTWLSQKKLILELNWIDAKVIEICIEQKKYFKSWYNTTEKPNEMLIFFLELFEIILIAITLHWATFHLPLLSLSLSRSLTLIGCYCKCTAIRCLHTEFQNKHLS